MLAITKDEFIKYAQEVEDEIFERRIKKAIGNESPSDFIIKITFAISAFVMILLAYLNDTTNIDFYPWYLCASFIIVSIFSVVIINSKAIEQNIPKENK